MLRASRHKRSTAAAAAAKSTICTKLSRCFSQATSYWQCARTVWEAISSFAESTRRFRSKCPRFEATDASIRRRSSLRATSSCQGPR
jgi:hypothetical protein